MIHAVLPSEMPFAKDRTPAEVGEDVLSQRCNRKRKLRHSSGREKKCTKMRSNYQIRGEVSPVHKEQDSHHMRKEGLKGGRESDMISPSGIFSVSTQDPHDAGNSPNYVDFEPEQEANFCNAEMCLKVFPSYHTLRQAAMDTQPDPRYLELMTSVNRITPLTRSKVLQWLVYVQRKIPEPLSSFGIHVAVNMFDRFLSAIANHADDKAKTKVANSLEIIAAACLLVASKMEDFWAIDARDLCGLNQQMFSKSEVFEWERRVIKTLHFHLNCPTALDFLNLYIHCARENGDWTTEESTPWQPLMVEGRGRTAYEACAMYLVEAALMHPQSLRFPVHLLAGAALVVMLAIIEKQPRNISVLPSSLRHKFVNEEAEFDEAIIAVSCIFEEEYPFCLTSSEVKHQKTADSGEQQQSLAGEVNAKHMDACRYLSRAYTVWKRHFLLGSADATCMPIASNVRRRASTGMIRSRKSLPSSATRAPRIHGGEKSRKSCRIAKGASRSTKKQGSPPEAVSPQDDSSESQVEVSHIECIRPLGKTSNGVCRASIASTMPGSGDSHEAASVSAFSSPDGSDIGITLSPRIAIK